MAFLCLARDRRSDLSGDYLHADTHTRIISGIFTPSSGSDTTRMPDLSFGRRLSRLVPSRNPPARKVGIQRCRAQQRDGQDDRSTSSFTAQLTDRIQSCKKQVVGATAGVLLAGLLAAGQDHRLHLCSIGLLLALQSLSEAECSPGNISTKSVICRLTPSLLSFREPCSGI